MIDQKKKKITDESFGFCILIFVFGVWKALTSELSSFRCSVITVTRGNYNFCGSLNEKGPHRFIGSGTSRRCGLVGGSMSLWVSFEASEAQARPQCHSLFLLSADPNIELSATSPVPCLPVCHCASCHNDSGLME
jgi:hypothetical protein